MFGLFKTAALLILIKGNPEAERIFSAWALRDREEFLARLQTLSAQPEKNDDQWEALALGAKYLALSNEADQKFGFVLAHMILSEAPEKPQRIARAAGVILKLAPQLAKTDLVLTLNGLREAVNKVPPRSKLEKKGLKILESLKDAVSQAFDGNAADEIRRFVGLRRKKVHPREVHPDIGKGTRFMFLYIPDLPARLRRQTLVRESAQRMVEQLKIGGSS